MYIYIYTYIYIYMYPDIRMVVMKASWCRGTFHANNKCLKSSPFLTETCL